MNTKVYQAVLSGQSDYNIKFVEFISLMEGLGFKKIRQNGSHILFQHPMGCMMNIQKDGSKAKGYQVAQLRKLIKEYGL